MTDAELMRATFPDVVPMAEAAAEAGYSAQVGLASFLEKTDDMLIALREAVVPIIKERDELKFRMDGLEK